MHFAQCSSNFGQVEQLVAVTGVSKEMATNLLEACGGNLEMAVRTKCQEDTEQSPIILANHVWKRSIEFLCVVLFNL